MVVVGGLQNPAIIISIYYQKQKPQTDNLDMENTYSLDLHCTVSTATLPLQDYPT